MNRKGESIIDAKSPLFSFSFSECLAYRDLLLLLIKKEFLASYKQTLLGPVWLVLQPLLTLTVWVMVFSRGVGLSTGRLPAPVFYLSGLLFFQFFSQSLVGISSCLRQQASVLAKVYFPRLLVPLSIVGWRLATALIQFFLFVLVSLYYHPRIGWPAALLVLPPLFILTGALSLGIGLVVTALTVKYRDLQQVMLVLTQLWLYATPILYPASALPATGRRLIFLNPMSTIVETFRSLAFGLPAPPASALEWAILSTIAILAVGFFCFGRVEGTFVDEI